MFHETFVLVSLLSSRTLSHCTDTYQSGTEGFVLEAFFDLVF